MKSLRIMVIVALTMVFSARIVFSEQPIRMLKASPKTPPEVEMAEKESKKKFPEPRKEKLTKEELEGELNKIPGEREKVKKANSKERGKLLKASPKAPPEVEMAEKEAKQKFSEPRKEKLTKEELEQELNKIPGEREKLEKIKKGIKPMSSLSRIRGFSLSMFNPFSATEAWAYTQAFLNNGNRYFIDSVAFVQFIGVNKYYRSTFNTAWYTMNLSKYSTFKGYALIGLKAQRTGWYVIDIYASKTKARLDHSGHGTVASWDFGYNAHAWTHYVTTQYLSVGWHYFYWRPDPAYSFVNSVYIRFW